MHLGRNRDFGIGSGVVLIVCFSTHAEQGTGRGFAHAALEWFPDRRFPCSVLCAVTLFFRDIVIETAAESDFAVGRVDTQDADLQFFSDVDFIFRALDLVCRKLGDMQQTFQLLLEFHEDTEVCDLCDLAVDDFPGLVLFGNPRFPRILTELFESQRDAFAAFIN